MKQQWTNKILSLLAIWFPPVVADWPNKSGNNREGDIYNLQRYNINIR